MKLSCLASFFCTSKHNLKLSGHGMGQNEFSLLADVYVQIVGIIQLCEQVAHETPPEQGVPDSEPKACASVGTQ